MKNTHWKKPLPQPSPQAQTGNHCFLLILQDSECINKPVHLFFIFLVYKNAALTDLLYCFSFYLMYLEESQHPCCFFCFRLHNLLLLGYVPADHFPAAGQVEFQSSTISDWSTWNRSLYRDKTFQTTFLSDHYIGAPLLTVGEYFAACQVSIFSCSMCWFVLNLVK